MARQTNYRPGTPQRWPGMRNESLAQRAMRTGQTQRRTTGGQGPVSRGTGQSSPGVFDARSPQDTAKLTGGLRTTETAVPHKLLNAQWVNRKTTQQPSIDLGDLGQAAMRDIDAQKAAAAETRQIAEASLDDINQQYREAMSGLRESLSTANQERAAKGAEVRDKVSDAFDKALEYTKQQNTEAEAATGDLKQEAAAERDLQRQKFKDTYALRMSTIMDGMQSQLKSDLEMIDEGIARGQITGRGSMSASEVASQMKAQARQTHLDRIAGVAADIGDKYAQSANKMYETSSAQYLAVNQAATQIEAQTGMTAAQIVSGITDAMSRSMPALEDQIAQGDLAALQTNLAIEQLGVRRPELAAELRLSSAYLPEVVGEYPLWQEMYQMQQLATMGQTTAMPLSNPTVTGAPSFRFEGGGRVRQPTTTQQPKTNTTTARQAAGAASDFFNRSF